MTGRTRIKICGIQRGDMAETAIDAGADALGFVIAESSPRQVSIDRVRSLVDVTDGRVTAVVVGRNQVDHPAFSIDRAVAQFHGDETCDQCSHQAELTRRPVIRGLAWKPGVIKDWSRCPGVDCILIDASVPGAGAPLDWPAIASVVSAERACAREHAGHDIPLMLAGGLDPANVGDAIKALHPDIVDVSSGVETSRGVKDAGLIRAFCDAVRAADALAGKTSSSVERGLGL